MTTTKDPDGEVRTVAKATCGLVMPISPLDGCDETHWQDVKEILSASIEAADFETQMVSDADEVGIIQKRIIQNLYENPVVVCDVSGKNPNVMFELGMRLAFDKPTIIVKDDKTDYSFDTAPIEHIEYPRDLRFAQIVRFKKELSDKIKATHKKSISDKDYTTFLKNFGTFTIPKLVTEEVPSEKFILDELQQIRKEISFLSSNRYPRSSPNISNRSNLCLQNCSSEVADQVAREITKIEGSGVIEVSKKSNGHYHLSLTGVSSDIKTIVLKNARTIVPIARLV